MAAHQLAMTQLVVAIHQLSEQRDLGRGGGPLQRHFAQRRKPAFDPLARCLGTRSVLAALDRHTGEIIAHVESRHRSREFIALRERLDARYPEGAVIRIVLDHHSSHVSAETRAYLATQPGRFQYVHTPVHASWLNRVEVAFLKMARTFLRQLRVDSLPERRERILLGIEEMNAAPVPFRWKSFDRLMTDNMKANQ